MYSYGYSYGYGLIGGNTYNPLINYDWSTTTTSGLRYLKDVGSTPTYNASMYFGRGAYFNGVDQSIEHDAISSSDSVAYSFCGKQTFTSNRYNLWTTGIGISYYLVLNTEFKNISYAFNSDYNYVLNLTKNSIKLYENGLLVINITTTDILYSSSKTIGRRGSSYYGASYLKDFYIFDRNLTQSEITQAYEQPELFYAMAQADSTCVLNMPMCETDGYVRNMKSYSEGNELLVNFNTHTDNSAWIGGLVTNQPDGFTKIEYGAYTNSVFYLREINSEFLSDLIVGDKYYIDVEVKTDSTLCYPDISGLPATGPLSNAQGVRRITAIITASLTNSTYIRAYCDTNNRNVYWKINTIKKLSGIHQITNYTTSVRDNAKNLQYGLQTCKFVRDGLGVIQSASDYLEADGVGYAIMPNTFMSASPTTEAYEFIIKQATTLDTQYYTKWTTLGQSSGISTIELTKNSLSSGFLRYRSSNGGGLAIKTEDWINSKMYITFVCNSAKAYIYVNGILRYTENTPNNHLLLNNIYLFAESSIYNVEKMTRGGSFRLFKVHNKALTQAEITANYNSYIAKGLLS